jgi:methyl-accepting chemotaxis protein
MIKVIAIFVAMVLAVQMIRWLLSRARTGSLKRGAGPMDELIEQMRRQATTGDFSTRVSVDPKSDLSGLVQQYNRVLDAVRRRVREAERSQDNAEQLLKENAELHDRVAELAHTNLQAVGREQRLIELQNEVNEMARRLGEIDPYDLPVEQQRGQIRLRA